MHTSGSISESKLRCIGCGYRLTGVTIGGVCPECGRPIEVSIRAVQAAGTSGLAVASLVLGILSMPLTMCLGVFSAPFAVLAVIFGHVARARVARRPGLTGAGMALAGFTLGYVCLSLIAVFGLFLVVSIVVGA